MHRIVILLCAVAMLGGCATHTLTGPVPDPHRYGELTPGVSTRDDAIIRLGRPTSVTALPPNTLLQWIEDDTIHVAILFGPNGRMIGVQHVFEQ